MDPPSVWQEQRQLCEKARTRLTGGEDFTGVARELSQGGTRKMGGSTGRRYLDSAEKEDRLLAALATGTLSQVIRTDNGFRLYRIDTRGGSEQNSWAATPWPARRILFRQALKRALANDTP